MHMLIHIDKQTHCITKTMQLDNHKITFHTQEKFTTTKQILKNTRQKIHNHKL